MASVGKAVQRVSIDDVRVFEAANRDVEKWLGALIAPMETQVREHQLQLRRRMESIKRIHKATSTLEDRVNELKQMEVAIQKQQRELEIIQRSLENALELGQGRVADAA